MMDDVIKALIQATAAQQEATRVQQQQLIASREEQRQDRELLKEVVQQLAARSVAAPPTETAKPTAIRASYYLQKLTTSDDVEAYLSTFERIAEREDWPKEQWAGLVAPFLSGEPQKAYFDLDHIAAKDYDKLKAEILARLGVTLSVRAQRVHQWMFMAEKPPRSQMHDLIHLTKKWLQPETLTGPQIVERIVMDRFLRSLPSPLRKWVSHADPTTADQLVEMVERYISAEELLSFQQVERTLAPKGKLPAWKKEPVTDKSMLQRGQSTGARPRDYQNVSGGTPPRRGPNKELVRCFRCHMLGHFAADCSLTDEPMQCDTALTKRRTSMYAQIVCTALPKTGKDKYLCDVIVEGKPVNALLDSGSQVTLMKSVLVETPQYGPDTVGVTCIHGDTREYSMAEVEIKTAYGTLRYPVGLVPTLPHDVILGRNFPHFWKLWETDKVMDQSYLKGSHPDSGSKVSEVVPEGGATIDFPFSVLAGESDEVDMEPQVDQTIPGGEVHVDPVEEDNDMPDLEIRRDNFASEQLKDPTLSRARANVKMIDGKPVDSDSRPSCPYLALQNDLLYQVVEKGNDRVEQLVVPKPYRRMVLDLAHKHVMGGHLGVEKTKERILQRFFWPGLHGEVEQYCSSCPDCQYSAPRPHFRSPLVPLPVIETPFERIAMDLVGPIVKSARGHQHILVIMDYATRYPEAIPLRNTSSKSIARELVHVFSRVRIPKEILTDQGTPFMSRVMKELCRLFKVVQLRTSVYHPQTDGLVERFNKTLKSMLKKVVDKDGKNWDYLLPYLMFAIREVPQSSTGYSPFELLYGRHPRGLLDIAKETWEGQPTPFKSVIEHIDQMQDRITAVMPIVREHMVQAQEAQQRVYNRGARVRNFSPGDRVLVLIPTVESKFLAKWQGPFEILEKIGEVNYKVRQPGKRKPEQVYHVNLIKPWKERMSLFTKPTISLRAEPLVPEVKVADSLSDTQRKEVQTFVIKNRDVFSEKPGRTSLVKHDIITEPGVRVNVKPYRVPEARREAISQEVKKMLELGVIEESHSDWSSPIVLIPKPDGSWRFCNDFRKLNTVSKFDAYPMPRVDELIERLGTARYLTTLDLTKGYWQIPLTDRAKEKTAFSTPEGLFQYLVLPFGLHGAPATFQRTMDQILRPHRQYAAAYLDDVVIHSSDWQSHLPRVQAVLDSIRMAGLTANPKKCSIGLEEAKYLGYNIGRGLVKPQLNKVQAIQDWPRPVTKKQVRAFLGITGYYRRFIANFATIAVPLTDLTKGTKSIMIKWNSEAEQAFQTLKKALCSQPVLITPDFTKKFIVQTDASDVGVGAVLSQIREGAEHPIVFLSKKLNIHERNYATVEKECLAVKWALEELRYYLLGRQFTLVTDHAPLKWMCENREKNRRVTRWFLALQNYKFTVEHRPGSQLGNADALSRVHCFEASYVPTPTSKQRGRVCERNAGLEVEGVYISPRFLSYIY
uniref:Gypsy retrotransposon integrase-like protein 1 n=1 Tax=Xenopus tropicalis TaxID=8364 RepID=A0A803JM67_XENTR